MPITNAQEGNAAQANQDNAPVVVTVDPAFLHFFKGPHGMAIPDATLPALANEGITTVFDLSEFDSDDIEAIASNFRKARPAIIFGAKSLKRLKIACAIVQYYETLGRPLSVATLPTMMGWPILKDFGEQHSALAKLKDGDKPSTPKITKSLTIMKWTEAFTHHLHVQIGTRGIPLSYIIRDDENPGQERPALLHDRSYWQQLEVSWRR